MERRGDYTTPAHPGSNGPLLTLCRSQRLLRSLELKRLEQTELAIHLGHQRTGWPGLLVAGVCFIVPAMLLTLAAAWAYVRFGTLPATVSKPTAVRGCYLKPHEVVVMDNLSVHHRPAVEQLIRSRKAAQEGGPRGPPWRGP